MAHTPDGPGPAQGYTCDLCYKKYTTRANLLIHTRTHTGNILYDYLPSITHYDYCNYVNEK